jgi:hypothetical protein
MIARFVFAFAAWAIIIMPGHSETVTVTVAGVTVNADQVRVDGIRVKMVAGGSVSNDTTWRGVYNLSEGGVDASTERLLVMCDEADYDPTAKEVVLSSVTGAVKRGKAEDIKLFSRHKPKPTIEQAGERLANADQTIALKVKWNLATPEEAHKEYVMKAGEIAAAISDLDADKWRDVLKAAQLVHGDNPADKTPSMCNGAWGSNMMGALPQLDSFKSERRGTDEKIRGTLKELQDGINGTKPLDRQAIEKLMTVPSTEIPSDWLTNPKVIDDLGVIVDKYTDEKRASPVDPAIVKDPEKLRQELDKNPRAKQLLLYEHLLRTPEVSEERKLDLRSRVKQLRPGLDAGRSR